jgi:preprotein translocase subunit SecY
MRFLEAFANIFRVPDLRKRLLFTLGLLAVYRLGGHIRRRASIPPGGPSS